MPSAVPGAGPWGGMYRLLCPWLCLPSWPLPAQCQLPAPCPVPLPAPRAALRTGSSGFAGFLQQLVSHQRRGEGRQGGRGAWWLQRGQVWTHMHGVGDGKGARSMPPRRPATASKRDTAGPGGIVTPM